MDVAVSAQCAQHVIGGAQVCFFVCSSLEVVTMPSDADTIIGLREASDGNHYWVLADGQTASHCPCCMAVPGNAGHDGISFQMRRVSGTAYSKNWNKLYYILEKPTGKCSSWILPCVHTCDQVTGRYR